MTVVRLKQQYASFFVSFRFYKFVCFPFTMRRTQALRMQDVICKCSLSRNLTSITKTTGVSHTMRKEEALHIQVKRLLTF